MSTDGFTLLWARILDSSIWQEDLSTRVVWITLLLMKNADGVVRTKSTKALAWRARVSLEECEHALTILAGPDVESTTATADGRRIRPVDGGWEIINHEQYRFSSEARRAVWRASKADQRAGKRVNAKSPKLFKKNREQPGHSRGSAPAIVNDAGSVEWELLEPAQ